jgi:ribonuclease G
VRSESRSGGRGAVPRRAAAQNEILINATSSETRVAILEQGQFTELHIEREGDRSVAGMVARGRVTRVLPGMQAAFVDIGLEKAAFLYVGDYRQDPGLVDPDLVDEGEAPPRRRGRNGNGRNAKIEDVLREGQEIVVQVAKEPIGTKGARITSHVSIAGRHLVLTPWSQRVGVSRRIESERERRRLREAVSRVRPADLGFIIRTAGNDASDADLEADVRYLTSVWDEIQIRNEQVRAPARLYSELSLPLRVLRDFANSQTRRLVIDDEETYAEMRGFLDRFVAEPKPALEHYTGGTPLFDHFGIESSIDDNLGKKVFLKSGGHLVFDQSEALTAIDVNTGRYVGKRDLEETVLKTNLEAVKEIVYQLRFRNIGGLIILDLIDMESGENREKVHRALREALRQDKAKTNILKISELGLVEMTRKRTRESLVQQLCEPCGHCEGRGYVLSHQSVAQKALREIQKDAPRFSGRQIALTVNPDVAEILLGPERKALAALGARLGRDIEVRARAGMHQEQFEVAALDEGPPVALELPWLEPRRDEARRGPGGGDRAPEEAAGFDAEARDPGGADAEEALDAGEALAGPSEPPPGLEASPEDKPEDDDLEDDEELQPRPLLTSAAVDADGESPILRHPPDEPEGS